MTDQSAQNKESLLSEVPELDEAGRQIGIRYEFQDPTTGNVREEVIYDPEFEPGSATDPDQGYNMFEDEGPEGEDSDPSSLGDQEEGPESKDSSNTASDNNSGGGEANENNITDNLADGSEAGGSSPEIAAMNQGLDKLPIDAETKQDIDDAVTIGEALAEEGANIEKDVEAAEAIARQAPKVAKKSLEKYLIAVGAMMIPLVIITVFFMTLMGASPDASYADTLAETPSSGNFTMPTNVKEYCSYVGAIDTAEAKSTYGSSESEVASNIVEVEFPQIGPLRVHRLAAPCFFAAGQQMKNNGSLKNYQLTNAGTFVWRCAKNTDGTCKARMSNHSYGIAIDVNPGTNPYRNKTLITDLPPGVIRAFKDYGFGWGGDWRSSKDPMHFEWLGRP